MYLFLAELVLLVHFLFIVLVVFGGLLVLKWPRLVWWHLAILAWGIYIEFSGDICPLTPLEVWLRRQAGETGYSGSFISQYILPIVYPTGLTHNTQIVFGTILIGWNILIYGIFIYAMKKRKRNG